MKLRRDPFQTIADPTRRVILMQLASQAMTAGTIAENFDAARLTILKHLKILHERDLVTYTQKGREVRYGLKMDKVKEIDQWLLKFKEICENRFNKLDNYFTQIQNKQKQ